ncbi:MAG TPA: chitobiase/beta-hexosaminidase C-terminal domain-containing protein [Ilumatobacteraceae bacterium]|nr:chitobiase/beta-hexosaminidase C-terminal domain-containing protein [Ilumatobacteraceae bacterium]
MDLSVAVDRRSAVVRRSLPSVRRRPLGRTDQRSQAGVTLLEVLAAVAITGVIVASIGAWMFGTLAAQNTTRTQAGTANVISMVNSKLIRDVATAQFAAASTGAPSGQVLADCAPTGADDPSAAVQPSDVRLVLVSPGDRRIVYTLVESPSGDGKALYRRDCPNTLAETAADPTLSDPTFLGTPNGDDAIPGTRASLVAEGIRRVELSEVNSACPADAPDFAAGKTADIRCKVVRLVIHLETSQDPLIFEAARRTDTYTPPNSPPVPLFTVSNLFPAKGEAVDFNAAVSYDGRDDYLPSDPQVPLDERLHYHWNFDTTGCRPPGLDPADFPDYSAAPSQHPANPEWAENPLTGYYPLDDEDRYPGGIPRDPADVVAYSGQASDDYQVTKKFFTGGECDTYAVTLTVTNNSGWSKTSDPVTITVQGTAPRVEIDPITVRVLRNRPVTLTSVIQTYEGAVDPDKSYWDFGDGTPVVPLVAADSNPRVSCEQPISPADCTAANYQIQHTYATDGYHIVRLNVTDAKGHSSFALLPVFVESEYYYVSAEYGTSTETCGPINDPTRPEGSRYEPCQTVDLAIQHAVRDGKSEVRVAKGDYAGFTAANGINVSGGRDDSGRESASWAYSPSTPTRVGPLAAADRRSITVQDIGSRTVLADMTVVPGNSTTSAMALNAVVVDNSRNIELRNLNVDPGSGLNATGVLVRNASQVVIDSSTIKSGTPTEPPALQVDQFTTAPDPANRSAYGVRATGGSTVRVKGGSVTASPGLTGSTGAKGANDETAACNGPAGVIETSTMGAACVSPNDGRTNGSRAGGGGQGNNPGSNGEPAGRGGQGGDGGWGLFATWEDAGIGQPGKGGPGATAGGNGGSGGLRSHTSAGDLWQGVFGATGGAATGSGSSGEAGGGAGGGGGVYVLGNGGSWTGDRGGGGGGGGRGALNGGAGGGVGGGSFGVYAHDSSIIADTNAVIAASKGGNGGLGGQGGKGGTGGNGGDGVSSNRAGPASGGGGGGGGAGAGGGGGGAAGPSVSVFHTGTGSIPSVSGSTLTFIDGAAGAQPGQGGAGGEGGSPGTGGLAGLQRSLPGAVGYAGATGAKGLSGEAGMACKLFSASAGSDCFSSSVVSIDRVGSTPILTNAGGPGGSLTWVVTFDAPVKGVTAANFAPVVSDLTTAGNAGISVVADGTDQYDDQWIVTVTGVTTTSSSNGTIALSLANVTGITDATNAQIRNASPTPFIGQSYTVDQTAPTVVSITRINTASTNAGSVSWYVTFSERVNGSDDPDHLGQVFTLRTNGVVAPFVIDAVRVTGQPNVFRVNVNTGSLSGTLQLDLDKNFNLVHDDAGNQLASGAQGDPYTVDKVPPTVVSIKRAGPQRLTTADEVEWLVTFSESVLGVDPGGSNFSLASSLTGTSVSDVTIEDDGRVVRVSAATGTGPRRGDILLNLSAIGAIKDPAGNALAATFGGPAVEGTHEDYLVDTEPPTVQIVRAGPAMTNSTSSAVWTATFSEPVNGAADVARYAIVETLAGTPTIATVTNPSNDRQTFRIEVTFTNPSNTGSGVIRLNLTASGAAAITDDAGNAVTGAVTGEQYTVDRHAPSTSASKNPPQEWRNPALDGLSGTTVTFSPIDDLENGVASGVAQTRYSVNAAWTEASSTAGGSFLVTADGVTTIYYASQDTAGNWESPKSIEVKIDRDAPSTTSSIIDGGFENGHHLGFAKVTLTASDVNDANTTNDSGIAQLSGRDEIWYTVDGSDPTVAANNPKHYSGTFTLRSARLHTVKFFTRDQAGNAEPVKTIQFTIESRGPVTPGLDVSQCTSPTATFYPSAPNTRLGDPNNLLDKYVNGGCVRLTAPDVTPFYVDAPVGRVTYYRCAWVGGDECNAEHPEAQVIGSSLDAANGWPVQAGQNLGATAPPSVERGYTIVAVAEDRAGVCEAGWITQCDTWFPDGPWDPVNDPMGASTTSATNWKVGVDLTAPTVAGSRPIVKGLR